MEAQEVFGSCRPSIPYFEVIQPNGKGLKQDNQGRRTINPTKKSRAQCQRKRPFHSAIEDSRTERTVFVGNIPVSCTRKKIKQLFKQHGCVETIRFRSIKVSPGDMPVKLAKQTRKQLVEGSSFNAYVVMSSSIEARNCLGLNGVLLQGRHLRIDIVARKEEVASSKAQRSVFIGNLPFSADEEKVRETFAVCGEIENIRIVRDAKSGVGKGFGFVTFKDKNGVLFALKQNNKAVVDSRTLRVCISKDHTTLQKEKQSKISGIKIKKKVANQSSEKIGKRRPDGTKNRHHRPPVPKC